MVSSLLVELFIEWVSHHPDALILTLMGVGIYWELHHGRIAKMMQNQQILGTAVFRLYAESERLDEERFRDDMWNDEDERTPYPGDWDRPTEDSNDD